MIGTLVIALLRFLGISLSPSQKEKIDEEIIADALIYAQEVKKKRVAHEMPSDVEQSLLQLKKEVKSVYSVVDENQSLISEALAEAKYISQDLRYSSFE